MIAYKVRRLWPDPRHESPRYWSNSELRRIAPLFGGMVVNVSAWKDDDKEGRKYREYFVNASDYWVTNYKADARGWQGNISKELFIDLEKPIEPDNKDRFDIVYNHTTLEHVFDVFHAFSVLCELSKDIVIVVAPFMQEQHGYYGDYWRFTPLCIERLFNHNGLQLVYVNYNDGPRDSIYIFAIGTKYPDKWANIRNLDGNKIEDMRRTFLGTRTIEGLPLVVRVLRYVMNLLYSRKF